MHNETELEEKISKMAEAMTAITEAVKIQQERIGEIQNLFEKLTEIVEMHIKIENTQLAELKADSIRMYG